MDKAQLEKVIRSGKIGIIPTDTIYGLVGLALTPSVVEKIYQLKKRDRSKPMIILISNTQDLKVFNIKIEKATIEILKKYWPGPTSVILPCRNKKFEYLHRGTDTLAFRVPDKADLQILLTKTGPVVAPSANIANEPPATNINQAKKYFQDKVDFYVDEGEISNKPSKLIALKDGKVEVWRK